MATRPKDQLLVFRVYLRTQAARTISTTLASLVVHKGKIPTPVKSLSKYKMNFYQTKPMTTISGTNLQVKEVIQINSNTETIEIIDRIMNIKSSLLTDKNEFFE